MKGIFATFSLWLALAAPFVALADERAVDADAQRLTVLLSEYRIEPERIVLNTGKPVELTLVNQGTLMHEFVTDALRDLEVDVEVNGVAAETLGISELEVPAKAEVVLRFTPEKPGRFSVVCESKDPKDHFKEGMSGKLVFQ